MASSGGVPMDMKFDTTLGSLLLGGMVAMALWGVTCVQTYTFFTRPRKDRIFVRAIVAFLLALDTFDSALNIHILYHYMVSNYLNPFALMIPIWSVIIHVAVTASSNFIIRAMFAHRIFRLSKGNIPITGWIMAISTADLVTGIIITVKAFKLNTYLELDSLSNLMYVTFAMGTGSDLSVAIVLCWLLRRSRTGFKKTDGMISVLMLYTVNTGLIVAVDAALGMIMYIVMPNNFVFLGFYLLLSKLYLNSYLATMNARQDLREQINDPVSIHLSDISQRRFDTSQSSGTQQVSLSEKNLQYPPNHSQENAIGVSIQTLTYVDDDKGVDRYQTRSIDQRGQAL